ncbi:hypothetical protein O181_005055 [Austropuccinia psidii MF-1]|uniref:Uncharacterized protein n=1 Tax=Austropuccinia psidii MF-1 TaxID=1389203 RepID=A0A9Q3GFG3_9BASI|nr:hypothetical protein [Austropuccinia psidii MF-1]
MTRKGLTSREFLLKLLFQIKLNQEVQPGDWKNKEQIIKVHKLLKDRFTCSRENKIFSMEASLAKVGVTIQNICLQKMTFLDLMEKMKVWNPNSNFKLLEERPTGIRENQAAIQAIETSWHMGEWNTIWVLQGREEGVPYSPQ